MLQISQTPEHVELHVRGKLTKTDYDSFVPRLEDLAAERGPLRLLVRLDDFGGWEPRALWEELKFDVTHQDELARVAIVGEDGLEKWGTQLAKPFFRADVEYFGPAEVETARRWLAEKGAGRTEGS